MPIKVYWDNEEQTIIRNDFEGHWTWEEYLSMMTDMGSMMRTVDHRVDAVGNMKPGIMPASGSAMALARASMRKLPSNCGLIVIVTNPFINALLNTFKKFDKELGATLRGVSRVEDAYTLIEREREQKLQP
jgi:hypothetical protein